MAGKKYNSAAELVNKELAYSVEEAIDLIEKTSFVKFDPTIEIHFNLNLEVKHADQIVRSTITLPNGSGKTPKICAFTDGNAKELEELGATIAGGEELIDNIAQGNTALDFDVCIASPTMMRHLGKIARILGPKGLMPNPKAGTVGPDLVAITKEIAAGKFEFKTDKQGNVHSYFGKLSFGKDKLVENLNHFLKVIEEVKPTGSKGKYINTAFICNAMGPSIKLDMSTEEK
ncbi:MAG: 50S ribosomal protein L1 [Candidatus Gracilibacteria bacterium]|nr:50S ribosomal protein L1 [Candidatus Gracilibacteria bacterium]